MFLLNLLEYNFTKKYSLDPLLDLLVYLENKEIWKNHSSANNWIFECLKRINNKTNNFKTEKSTSRKRWKSIKLSSKLLHQNKWKIMILSYFIYILENCIISCIPHRKFFILNCDNSNSDWSIISEENQQVDFFLNIAGFRSDRHENLYTVHSTVNFKPGFKWNRHLLYKVNLLCKLTTILKYTL